MMLHSLWRPGDALNLDSDVIWVPRDLDTRACRLGAWQQLLIDGVDSWEVIHVLKED